MAQVGVERAPTRSVGRIPGSKPRWSAGCLPSRQWSRMESNHRFLGVDQVSLPLDHGTVSFKWSHRESHPDLQRAELASSCWTMTPCLFKRKPDHRCAAVPLEPTSGRIAAACLPSRFLTNSDGFRYQSCQGGSRETRTHKRFSTATCFQDRLLIRPDGFHRQAAEAGIEPA